MRFLYPSQPNSAVSFALLLLRLIAGSAFILHGWPKVQHPLSWMGAQSRVPGWVQALAAISESAGGLAWILGFFTVVASFGILCTMAHAVYFHIHRGDPFISGSGGADWELAVVYLAVALLFMLAGPGRFSLDASVFGRSAVGKPKTRR